MPEVLVEDVVKDFIRVKRQEGRLGGLRTLFTRERIVRRAVDGITLSLEEGEMIGFLGPNGAGKSTTIKMLTGVLTPTSGTIRVGGLVPWRQRKQNARQIGVVFGQRSQLWWDLPLAESFRLISKMYEVPPERYRANLDTFVELLDLGSFLDSPVRSLSLGQRMRGDLAAAMLYEPRILFLDEPTVGLDVVAKQRIRAFVGELNREHAVTVILTTHDLDDVEELCQRIILIDKGRLMYDGSAQKLKDTYAPYRVLRVHLTRDVPVEIPHATEIGRDGTEVSLRFNPSRIPASALIREVTDRYEVSDLSISEPDLEGVLARLYTSGDAEPAARS